MRFVTGSLVLALVLGGCAAQRAFDPNSPYTVLPVGSTIVLDQPLDLPADSASIWIQKGKLVKNWRNVYYPACKFEMWTRAKEERTVAPDRFRVTRVVRDWTVSSIDAPFRLVSVNSDDAGGPSVIMMETAIYLHSEKQPDVYRLTCEQWEIPPHQDHVTINEMNATLRGFMHIELPPP